MKGTPVEQIPNGVSSDGGLAGENGNGTEYGNGRSPAQRRSASGGLVTAEVFSQLVRENPENMTQAIQTWLSRGKPPQN